MVILKPLSIWIFTILSFGITNYSFSQTQIIGKVISAKNQNPLAHVNIGIKEKKAYGIFLDNTYKSYFNMGAANKRFYWFGAEKGELRGARY